MPASIFTLESFNVICGDTGDAASPGISTHLEVTNVKLPGLELNMVDHTPGGAPVQIEVPMFENKLESTFTLAGWNPAVMSMFAQWARALNRFTVYGLVRDRRSGNALQVMALYEGQLGRANAQDARKNDLFQVEYAIKSIVHYELYMQEVVGAEPTEIMFWDFFTSTRRMGGVDLNAEMNTILAIPVVTV
jgi:P2 family phage contractile tail tube protein